jgi:hypothetical protein
MYGFVRKQLKNYQKNGEKSTKIGAGRFPTIF